MNIGLVDIDGHRFPNLALMKLSAYHKAQGDTVEWASPLFGHYDRIYMSKVFSSSPDDTYAYDTCEIIRGGSGYCIRRENGREVYDKSKDIPLPDEVEHIYPDYSIYPDLTADTAYGFLTRGCPRGCDFCHVGVKEGRKVHRVAKLSEFWHGQKNIVLLDPNILAYPRWNDLLDELKESRAWIDFNQGLDARLMTEQKARALSQIKIKEVHFAWDRYRDRERILEGLKIFAEYNKKIHSHSAIVYVLCHFDTTIEQDLERIYTLRDLNFFPYVMVYDRDHAPSIYKALQRWVNNRFVFAKCKRFEDYDYL